jgi:hypothetical protein
MRGRGTGEGALDEAAERLPAAFGIGVAIEPNRKACHGICLVAGHAAPQPQNGRIPGQLEQHHGARPEGRMGGRDQEHATLSEIDGVQEDVLIRVFVGGTDA